MINLKRLLNMVSIFLVTVLLVSCGIKDRPAASNQETTTASNSESSTPIVEKSKLYPASVNEEGKVLWGYINNKGEFIIKPSFERAEEFQGNGLALAGSNEAVGLIDGTGRFVVEQKYNYVSPFTEGIAIADGKDGYSVIDEKGQVIFQSPNYISDYSEGMIVFSVQNGDKYLNGFVDKLGKTVIEAKYEYAEKFIDGKAVVRLSENKYGIIDKTGKLIKEFDYGVVNNVGEGLYSFKKDYADKAGLMDEKGNVIKPPTFNYVETFKNGLAVASISDENSVFKVGVINKSGEFVIKPDYSEIRYLGEGLYAAGIPIGSEWPEMGSKFGIMNSEGKLLTDYIYYGVNNYNNGLASVHDKFTTFFINKEGKKDESIGSFEGIGELYNTDDLIKVNVDNRISYVDKSGNVVWKSPDEYKLGDVIAVTEKKYRPNWNVLVYYPEISGIADSKGQEEVNKTLREEFTSGDFKEAKPEDDLGYNYQAGFSIKYYNKDLLSLEKTGYYYPFGAAHGMPVQQYYHINLKSGKTYALKDLFKAGSGFEKRINGIISKRIESKPDDYFPDSFQGIRENQPFVLTKDSLCIYFAPYEIASYAAGFPTFEIPYKDIMDIINTDGELWKAFN